MASQPASSVNQHVSGFKGAKGPDCTGSSGFKGEETHVASDSSRWFKLERRESLQSPIYICRVDKINGVIGKVMQ